MWLRKSRSCARRSERFGLPTEQRTGVRERVGLRVWRATNGLWTGEVRVGVGVRVRVRVSDGVWAGDGVER